VMAAVASVSDVYTSAVTYGLSVKKEMNTPPWAPVRYFSCVGFGFLCTSQEIGWKERLENDLYFVLSGWDVKP